jgi:hypothetical protein
MGVLLLFCVVRVVPVVLCCVVSCHVVLCCVVSCHIVLCVFQKGKKKKGDF